MSIFTPENFFQNNQKKQGHLAGDLVRRLHTAQVIVGKDAEASIVWIICSNRETGIY